MQNIFSGIRGQLPELKKVQTRVQTEGGKVFVEERDDSGGFAGISNPQPRSSQQCRGFVYDFKPDLQMAEVSPKLFLGSQDVASEKELMLSKGVTHIINSGCGIKNHFPETFTYKKLDIYDNLTQDISSIFQSCIMFIDEAMANGGAVFVHCNAGVSRSTSICVAWMIQRKRMRLEAALAHIRTIRPYVRPNDGFMRQLLEFEIRELGAS